MHVEVIALKNEAARARRLASLTADFEAASELQCYAAECDARALLLAKEHDEQLGHSGS